MGIHRARFALAVIALAGLAGCTSGSSNNLAFWKSNPLSSKTAAATPKPQYPAKPSTQVGNPTDAMSPTAGGLASRATNKSSATYPGATTSFTSPSSPSGGVSPTMGGAMSPARSVTPSSASTMDPVVSPQRGYYSSPTSNSVRPATQGVATPAGVGAYPSADPAASRGTAAPTSGFRSGAKDYTSSATDYTASSNTGSTRTGGATIPRFGTPADRAGPVADRFGAASDRFGPNADRAATGADAYGSGTRTSPSYDPIASARAAGPAPYGPSASPSGVAGANSRNGATDPFQASGRSSPYVAPGAASERYTSPYGVPGAASNAGTNRNSTAYANPFASQGSARPTSPAQDRPSTPNYRDYPATDPSASRASNPYNPPAGGYAPAAAGPAAPPADYRPGDTGYNPPASDYRPGDTGYNPSSTSPYRAPSGSMPPGSAPASDEAPPFRPGSTSDYVPNSATPGPAASTAARDTYGSRTDSSVQPTGYTAGGPDYRR